MRHLPALLLLLAPALAGCDLLAGDCVVDGDLTTCTSNALSDADGIASIPVVVGDQRAFQLTAMSSTYVAVERVFDQDDDLVVTWEDWYDSESLSAAFWLEGKDTVLNWPVRAEDVELDEGTWRVEVAVVDAEGYYQPETTVEVVTKLKDDGDLDEGRVRARVVYCEGLAQDPTVVEGVEDAVAKWADIWAAYGLELDAHYEESDFDPDLAFPGYDTAQESVADGADGAEITVLVGETIDGGTDYLGVAGGIPGTLATTPRALVIVSWLANAGPDGDFDSEDIRLFGETLAHEVGHYTGLFHPVEMDWSYWDALDDTPHCANQSTCEDQLGANLMFPYPVCAGASCVHQDELTDGQQGVGHLYTGTL